MIDFRDIWATAFAPADRRSIEAWALDNVRLPPSLSRQGKFSCESSRHFLGPLQALRHDKVRGVRILKPVRGGGTLIADVAVPWAIVNDNASVLWVFQDKDIAEAHAETRQMPILESVPAIKPMLSLDKNKTRKSNILFANGLPFTMQGPAIGKLQSRGFKWVICDEPWLYKPGVLSQAVGRLGDFVKLSSSKFLAISQGGDEDGEWDLEYKNGVQFVWNVPCAGCGKLIQPEWTTRLSDGKFAGAVWDTFKLPDGTYNKDACAATVRFVCPSCGHVHPNTEKTRATWNTGGAYVNPVTGEHFDSINPPTECSFRWHALIDFPWGELVKLWLGAQEAKHVGNLEPLISFFQKRCALMRSERTIHDSDILFARTTINLVNMTDKAWPEESDRALTADRQSEDLFYVTARAWARSGESRRLFRGKVYGDAAVDEVRRKYNINPNCTLVDSGYMPKGDHGVYAACIKYGWFAVKGTDEAYFWHHIPKTATTPEQRIQKPWAPLSYGDPGEGLSTQGKRQCKLIRFASNVMADRVDALIAAGLFVEPDGDLILQSEDEKDYIRQMGSEFKKWMMNKRTFKREQIRVCPTGNNHYFDCAKEQVLFAMVTGHLPAGVELEKPVETKPNA
jgi:phage terminase large subunit GpA